MNLAHTIRKSRLRSLVAVLAVAGSALGATLTQPVAADAAEFHTSVACMESASSPVASHSCLANELPAVYFESTVATWFDLCVEAPDYEVSCSGDNFAEADHRYYWPITAREVGTYTATAWVGEYEVGVWRFLVEPASASPSPSAGAPSPSEGSPMPSGSPTAPGLELGTTPSSLEVGGAPTPGAAPTTSPVCQAAAKQVSKLMGELKHASKKQVHGLESKLKADKAKAKKAC